MRGDQLARQWHILQFLSNSSQGRHLNKIADEVGCSPRNVRRDLLALQEAGFSIYQEKQGQTTLWKMSDSFNSNPPIPLTLMEIVALLLVETELRSAPDDFISQAFSQVTEKIMKSRPPAFRDQMELLQEKFYSGADGPPKTPKTASDLYEVVSNAIRHRWQSSHQCDLSQCGR